MAYSILVVLEVNGAQAIMLKPSMICRGGESLRELPMSRVGMLDSWRYGLASRTDCSYYKVYNVVSREHQVYGIGRRGGIATIKVGFAVMQLGVWVHMQRQERAVYSRHQNDS